MVSNNWYLGKEFSSLLGVVFQSSLRNPSWNSIYLFIYLFMGCRGKQREVRTLKMIPANRESRHTFCCSLDMPLLMSGFLGRGCQRVSKNLPGKKGGVALLGIYPPEAPAHVWKDVYAWLFMAALLIAGEFWNPRFHLQSPGGSMDIPTVEYYAAGKIEGLLSVHSQNTLSRIYY